jgi:NADH dehydrogenase (ubiquinone) flavoprotein 1
MLRRVAVRSGVRTSVVAASENAAAPAMALSAAGSRSYSTGGGAVTERSYGNLKDSDRIFTNLYGEQDIFIKGAMARVSLYSLPPPKMRVKAHIDD